MQDVWVLNLQLTEKLDNREKTAPQISSSFKIFHMYNDVNNEK